MSKKIILNKKHLPNTKLTKTKHTVSANKYKMAKIVQKKCYFEISKFLKFA